MSEREERKAKVVRRDDDEKMRMRKRRMHGDPRRRGRQGKRKLFSVVG